MKAAPFFFALPLVAHSLYVLPQRFVAAPGEGVLISVHNGDSFPTGSELPDPGGFAGARLTSAAGSIPLKDFYRFGKAASALAVMNKPGVYWVVVETEPRLLELEAARFESYLRDEGLEDVLEWRRTRRETGTAGRERYRKFAKSLLICGAADDGWSRNLGLTIEFVLEADPGTVRPGGFLPIQVLWHGRPAAGLQVESSWAVGGHSGTAMVGRTDEEGRLRIPLDRPGRWRLHTVAMKRAAGGDGADWESDWASLTFELPDARVAQPPR